MLLAHVVVVQARAGDKAGPCHDSIPRRLGCGPLGVAAVDGVELRPEHLGLEFQRRHRGVLLLARAAALDDEVERVLRVARRLHEPRPEVVEAGRVDPRVVALQCLEPHPDRGRPEQLGERRGHRLDPRLLAAKFTYASTA